MTDTAPKTTTQGGPPLTATQFANQTWAALVLVMVGAPVTPNNLSNMLAWMAAENSPSTWTGTAGANNPLNNGLGSGGGDGTGSYPDLFTAAYYAAKGIEGGIFSPNCGGNAPGGIATALKADAPFAVFKEATIKSGWAGGCYSGSGYRASTSPANVPVVTAADSAKNGATSGVKVGNVTQADLGDPGALQQAEQGIASGTQGAVKAATSLFSWTEELAKILGEIDTLAFWERFGMGVLGVGLLVFGAVLFFSSTKTGQRAISEGEKATGDAAVVAAA